MLSSHIPYMIISVVVLLVFLAVALNMFSSPAAPENSPAAFKLTSTAFEEGNPIPDKYAAKGKNVSPPLAWVGAPKETKSFALIVEDPDATRGAWVHWVAFNIPGTQTGLPENTGKNGAVPGMIEGKNSGGNISYDGPAPPSGTHRYYFRLYALDVNDLPGVARGATAAEVRAAMKGHELGHATLMGRYSAGR